MADQATDVSPFVQQYGQVRLVPIAESSVGSSQGSSSKGGPASEPTGSNKMTSPPGAGGNSNAPKVAVKTLQQGGGSNALPYLLGGGAAAGGAYALKRYLDGRNGKAPVADIMPPTANMPAPTDAPMNVTSGQVPDPITRPVWTTVPPEKGGLPAVIQPRNVVPARPYMPSEPINPAAIEAVTRLLK